MKIKCPICTIDDLDTDGELFNHILCHSDTAVGYLTDLLIKIHEKIEEYDKDVWGAYQKSWVIKELKSLLENEK